MDVTKSLVFVVNYTKNTYHHPLWDDLPFGKWKLFKFPWVWGFWELELQKEIKKERKFEFEKRKLHCYQQVPNVFLNMFSIAPHFIP
jgi:hypothetical protein